LSDYHIGAVESHCNFLNIYYSLLNHEYINMRKFLPPWPFHPFVLFLITTNIFSQNIITVTDCNLNGWVKQITSGTSLVFKTGIGTPPLGKGSLEFASSNVNFVRLRNTVYHNTLLSSITELSYSTYVQNRENNLDVNYIVLQIDKNGDGRTDDNLIFDPRYQNGHYIAGIVPDQGPTLTHIWQTWDMLHGGWWQGPPPRPDPDQGGSIFSLAAYINQNPSAKIINDPAIGGGGIRLTAGAVVGIFAPNFIGYADAFKIGVNGVTTTYDFESSIADAGADQTVVSGNISNCATLNGAASGGVAPYTYIWTADGATSSQQNPVVCPDDNTIYTVTVKDANGCSGTDQAMVFVTAPEKFKLSFYPNPFSKETRIYYELPSDARVYIKIYDAAGKDIITMVNGDKKAGQYVLDFNTENKSKGIYYCKMYAAAGLKTFSVIKKMIAVQ
jgi:hypothetical protein